MTQVHSDMDWIPSSELTTCRPPDYVSRVDSPGFPSPSNSTIRASPVYERVSQLTPVPLSGFLNPPTVS